MREDAAGWEAVDRRERLNGRSTGARGRARVRGVIPIDDVRRARDKHLIGLKTVAYKLEFWLYFLG